MTADDTPQPTEYFGDTVTEEPALRMPDPIIEPIIDFDALGLGPDGDATRAGPKLWVPDADTRLRMPARGPYAKGHPVGAVVHFTAGRSEAGDADAERTVAYGKSQGHCYFCISRTGRLYQTAPLSHWGYHAGESHHPGLGDGLSRHLVGIEICNAGLVTPTDKGFEPWWNKPGAATNTYYTAADVRYVTAGANITATGHYHRYTEAQEATLFRLLGWLRANAPAIFETRYVLGHDEIAPKRKTDPGGALSMTMAALRTRLESGPVG
ncbi:MAG: N-acetylmuramoyl-L-alanine amidase [Hyphomicrobiaceae bacterium]